MTKVLVVYYSTYGHMEIMAEAATAAANEVDGVEATLKRFAEIVPEEVAKKNGFKLDQTAPVATPDELPEYDGILFGTPTRFGNMAAQMKIFIDNCVGLWATDAMVGKVAGVFTSSAAQHGGQESTILSTHIPLLHLGFVLVGLPYSFKAQNGVDEVLGGSPYGASTIADNDGSRLPSQRDLEGVRYQARHLADVASKLAA